ncbi:hypothetical protein BU15DRAFT_63686 [Melanogaster broomeanus]|nr:hypothetical protein BU15DRAFT_63686 [Melanogaster broomeanus]
MDPPPHERNHSPTDGPVTSKATPWTRCVGDGPTASKLNPSPQERPRASQKWTRSVKMGPLHHKRTRRVQGRPTASKSDRHLKSDPHRLKSDRSVEIGPTASRIDPSSQKRSLPPTTSKTDPSPQKRPHPSRKWTGHLKNNHVASKADSLHQNGPAASNTTPPSQKQARLDPPHRTRVDSPPQNGSRRLKMDPVASKIILPSRKQT